MPDTRIADIRVTPIAFHDPPLLNNAGCHQPFALRSIIEVETEDGVTGLGESYGGKAVLDGLADVIPGLIGMNVTDLNALWVHTSATIRKSGGDGDADDKRLIPPVVGAIEVAMWDALGKTTGLRVCDLLGGRIRESVPFSAYLFYKFARHADQTAEDCWGEILTPDQLVGEAQRMFELHGFDTIKLKGGVFAPLEEIEGLRCLREAFPASPLRIDPNGGWTVDTALSLLPQLDGLIEYLEDPVPGIEDNARVQAATDTPLASNMYVGRPAHLPRTAALDAFRVILCDHHKWGGLKASLELARICEVWGLGLSMHSNSHLGISLAAMVHLAAATPSLAYDCDTHYPWQIDEVIEGGKLRFSHGRIPLPKGPGLGVNLDRAQLQRLHQNYLNCGIDNRDDESEMKKHWPEWSFRRPRF